MGRWVTHNGRHIYINGAGQPSTPPGGAGTGPNHPANSSLDNSDSPGYQPATIRMGIKRGSTIKTVEGSTHTVQSAGGSTIVTTQGKHIHTDSVTHVNGKSVHNPREEPKEKPMGKDQKSLHALLGHQNKAQRSQRYLQSNDPNLYS